MRKTWVFVVIDHAADLLESQMVFDSLSDLSRLVDDLNKVHEALQNLGKRSLRGLDGLLTVLVDVGQVLDGAGGGSLDGLGLLQGVRLVEALGTLLQLLFVKVAILVEGFNSASGPNDEVLVGRQLLQVLAGLVALLVQVAFFVKSFN